MESIELELIARLRVAASALQYALSGLAQRDDLTHDDRRPLVKAVGGVVRLERMLVDRWGADSLPERTYDEELYPWISNYTVALSEASEYLANGQLDEAKAVWNDFLAEEPPGFIQWEAHQQLSAVLERIGSSSTS